MDITTMIIAAVAILVVAALVLMRVFKKTTLEETRLHYGERIIFDDDNCKVDLLDDSGEDSFSDIFVRVTNKRMMIAQRGLGRSGKHMLKYIIYYDDVQTGKTIATGMDKAGFAVCKTEPSGISLKEDGVVRVEITPGQGAGVPAWFTIKSDNTDNYREIFQL
jgi:hypothetical protein